MPKAAATQDAKGSTGHHHHHLDATGSDRCCDPHVIGSTTDHPALQEGCESPTTNLLAGRLTRLF
jgi:hypothetical protein